MTRSWWHPIPFLGAVAAFAASPNLEITLDARAIPRLSHQTVPGMVSLMERSADLLRWQELARTHGGPVRYPDLDAPGPPFSFYRAYVRPKTANDDWKHQFGQGDIPDPFLSPLPPWGAVQSRWVKFAILLHKPHRVLFQDSSKYTFHYDFARARIPEFAGMSRDQFDAVALRTPGQQAVLGALVLAPTTNLLEAGIQIVGLDPYPPEQVGEWLDTVRAMLVLPAGTVLYYLPTFEQTAVAREHSSWFASRGWPVSTTDRWTLGDECYAPGWAVGTLRFFPADQIESAYRAGQLGPADILLTDAVPAEVPPLAGIIALTPATPNSHVALLAQSFGVPFAYPADPALRNNLLSLDGREVFLRALALYGSCELALADLASPLPPAERASILTAKQPPKLNLTPKQPCGHVSLPADLLRPTDIRWVGGKAANFGLLRRAIPSQSPSPALAFTFDLWEAYLDQTLPSGPTLRSFIAGQLAGFAWPPDMTALKTALANIRQTITDQADFTPSQQQAIVAALQAAGLNPDRNIRFRSSTNVEDTDQFSGAGLYDSFSGCLADDLDADREGPCQCDLVEPKERGVFRALRKVYASFYNDNAFLERLRHGVDESTVGMAVLVHHSTPDEFELANGVATASVHRAGGAGSRFLSVTLVTQAGAVSVANPDPTARPERVTADSYAGSSPYLTLESPSTLVPLGGSVLNWEREYRDLFALLDLSARAYEAEFPSRNPLLLDLEYKKAVPGTLLIKQIRELPRPDSASTTPTWMLNTTSTVTVYQGEHGDAVANHRLKSWWTLATRLLHLTNSQPSASLFSRIAGEWRDGVTPDSIDGPPVSLPSYEFVLTAQGTEDRWAFGIGSLKRTMVLQTQLRRVTSANEGPLTLLDDHELTLEAHYASPQPSLGYDPVFTTVTNESVRLVRAPSVTAECIRQTRVFQRGKIRVETAFFWPPAPRGPTAGYTAPLQGWIQTTLTGLTSRPIVLGSPWSQTYHPGHHNFSEEFVFEPRLDPEVDADLLAELTIADFRALIVSSGLSELPRMYRWGLDERFTVIAP